MHWMKRHRRGRPPHPDVLTPAEWRVLEHVRKGRPNAEIAVRLGVSVTTVKTHVSNILAKTGASDRRALAVWEGRPASAERRAAHALALPFLGRGTKEALMSTLKVAGLGAGVLVAVAAVVVGFAMFSDGGEADDGVVAVIEGIEVTEEEWERSVTSEDPTTACLREVVETMDPRETEDAGETLAFIDEIEGAHSREARILGHMILSYSAEAEARRRGLEPTDAEVAQQVTMNRESADRVLREDSANLLAGQICYRRYIEAQIAEHGEDRYWSEVAPERKRHSLLRQNLWRAEDVPLPFGGDFGFDMARSADIHLSPALDGVVTLDDAYAYLDHYRRLSEESAGD